MHEMLKYQQWESKNWQIRFHIQEVFSKQEFTIKSWKEHELNPKTMDNKAIDWIFFTDSLNFSFWGEDENKQCKITFNNKSYSGWWAFCAAVNRALKEGIPSCDPKYYSAMTEEQLKYILRSDTEIEMPLLEKRLYVAHEVGNVLIKRFGGSFVNCITQCEESAQKLLKMITENFPSFRDEADFMETRVSFYKRAQILIGDIWGCFEGKGLGTFTDISSITMFADYRIPQVLVYFGALEYSEELLHRLESDDILESGERYEVEIRGCTIWAVELVCKELEERIKDGTSIQVFQVNPILVDHFLWDYCRGHNDKMKTIPFHKTRSIYY
ncbi:queuosine 5'-phosphate N-glycosylase/hydrolase isoform X2 [Tachypleus tridentatus]|uniref:queuosine 5'-phosphate N-glycosylase/hydrolase isoform X2 n=1 Tax=Tachypleus tridentatus TaxID=6853 RepID=UPI003FD5379D